MAGFFGLFNYEKAGPGIAKDAPKKKTFVVFFETFFRNFWKFIPINTVFLLSCVPVVTTGLAACGLTNITRNIARDKHSFGLSDYWSTVKKNWKQGLIAGIINLLLSVLLFGAFRFYGQAKSWIGSIGLGVSVSLIIIFLIMKFYIWTMIITFDLPLKKIYRNSFMFVFLNFKMNLLCGIILLAIYALLIFVGMLGGIASFLMLLLFILCVPALRFLLVQYCTFPAIKKFIIDPYYAEHPDEGIEQRRNLGIEVDDPTQTQAEFSDSLLTDSSDD